MEKEFSELLRKKQCECDMCFENGFWHGSVTYKNGCRTNEYKSKDFIYLLSCLYVDVNDDLTRD